MDPKAFTNYILIGISESDSFLELNSKGDADDDVGRDVYVVTNLLDFFFRKMAKKVKMTTLKQK